MRTLGLGIGMGGSLVAIPWKPSQSGTVLADYNPGVFSSLILNSGNVSQLADTSGSGDANKNAAQVTVINQPPYNANNASYNNLPTITFSATGMGLTSGNWAAAQAEPYTIFYVGHTTSATGSRCFLSSNLTNVVLFDSAAGEQMRFSEDVGTTTVASGVSTVNTPSITFAVGNGASSQIGVNKRTPNATGSVGATKSINDITLGNIGQNQNLGQLGPMARALVYQGVLSPANIATVMNALGLTYGIAISA